MDTAKMSSEEFWEGFYQENIRIWSGRPNAVLADVVEPLPAGTALDLGCGEGGDAIWLAGRGWRVTAVDVSTTTLERVAARAAEADLADRVETRHHDLAETFPDGRFDLVSAQYLHSPVEFPRTRALRSGARAVASGGLLLVVDHGSVMPWWRHRHPDHRFETPEEVLNSLELDPADWEPARLDSPQRWATGPSGQRAIVTDHVLAIRRV